MKSPPTDLASLDLARDSELELVARMRAGEQDAFDAFFYAYASRLAAFAQRRSSFDAASIEDIVQNALIKAVRHLESYRGESHLFAWLTMICRREMLDAARKAKRRPAHDSLDDPRVSESLLETLQLSSSRDPAADSDSELRRLAILRALNSLPANYAFALEAKYGDGLSVQEIARALQVSDIAAQSLLARARTAFRDRWLGEEDAAVDRGLTW